MKFSLDVPVEKRAIRSNRVSYELPYMPPSTNNLYANVQGRGRVKTTKYRDWLMAAGLMLKRQGIQRMTGRVDIVISLEDRHPTRDASNCTKPVEDLLVQMGVLQDDRAKFVRSIQAVWAPISGIRIDITSCAFEVAA